VRRERRLAAVALACALVLSAPVGAADAPGTPARFDGAAALRHVERLVVLGPRPAGSPAGEKARAYITAALRALKITVEVREFTAETPHGRFRMANVVAVLPGRRPDVILVGGHYDTKWFRDIRFVGANDGGSSTAFLLELARRLAARPHEYTYWIVWFDGEEARESWTATDSLYGSRQLASELERARRLPRAVLVIDMIGDRELGLRREAYSTPWLTDLVWSSAARLGHGGVFLADSQPVEDDHAPFLRAGVPAALLIDFDFPPWHTAEDTLDKVSARSLAVVGDVLLDALPRLEESLTRAPGGPRP
jgi:Zn-dependent M28 family amino/carboxypeptidase